MGSKCGLDVLVPEISMGSTCGLDVLVPEISMGSTCDLDVLVPEISMGSTCDLDVVAPNNNKPGTNLAMFPLDVAKNCALHNPVVSVKIISCSSSSIMCLQMRGKSCFMFFVLSVWLRSVAMCQCATIHY